MMTIFTCPKPFTDPHIRTIQRNAIGSWQQLQPKCEVILLGDDLGVRDVAAEYHVKHVPDIERNEHGTPLINSLFARATASASNSLLAYVNADILLSPNFAALLLQINLDPFLAIGRRWCLEMPEPSNAGESCVDQVLWERLVSGGKPDASNAIDYFVFRRNMWRDIPPFALGRTSWDNWLVWWARSAGIPVVDLTECIKVIHQRHDYSHYEGGQSALWHGAEAQENLKLAGGYGRMFDLDDATHFMVRTGVVPFRDRTHLLRRAERLSVLRPRVASFVPWWKARMALCWTFPNL